MIEGSLEVFINPRSDPERFDLVLGWLAMVLTDWFVDRGADTETAEDLAVESIRNITARLVDEFINAGRREQGVSFRNWCEKLAEEVLQDAAGDRSEGELSPLAEAPGESASQAAVRIAYTFLTPEQREILRLAENGLLTPRGVSSRLGITEEDAAARLNSAWARLRDFLELDPDIRRTLSDGAGPPDEPDDDGSHENGRL